MEKWYTKNQGLIWATGVCIGSIIWIYATFPTKEVLADQMVAARTYVDKIDQNANGRLDRIESALDKLNENTIEILKEMRKR